MKKILFAFLILTNVAIAVAIAQVPEPTVPVSKFKCNAGHLDFSFSSEKGILNAESDLHVEVQGVLLTVLDFKTKFVSLDQNKLTVEIVENRDEEVGEDGTVINPKLKAIIEIEIAGDVNQIGAQQGKIIVTQRSNILRLRNEYVLSDCEGNLN